jgi:hypothetical protein
MTDPNRLAYATPHPPRKSRGWIIGLGLGGAALALMLLGMVAFRSARVTAIGTATVSTAAPTGTYQGKTIDHWLPLLNDGEQATQEQAAKAVCDIYGLFGSGRAQLMQLLSSPGCRSDARFEIALFLCMGTQPGDSATLAPILLDAVELGVEERKTAAAYGLLMLGKDARSFAPKMRDAAAKERDDSLRSKLLAAADEALK